MCTLEKTKEKRGSEGGNGLETGTGESERDFRVSDLCGVSPDSAPALRDLCGFINHTFF